MSHFYYSGRDHGQHFGYIFTCLTDVKGVHDEVLSWLDENFKEEQNLRVRLFVSGLELNLIKVRISRDADAVAFRMRWC